TVDLNCTHCILSKTPIEHTMQAMANLKAQGKIKYLSRFEISTPTLSRTHAAQSEGSPFFIATEDLAKDLLAACGRLGVAVAACSPTPSNRTVACKYYDDDNFVERCIRRFMTRSSAGIFRRIPCGQICCTRSRARSGARPGS
ncbi:hypothetical protein B0J12DRAFT_584730, partial [Macrophomina phaseolina]